jgi:uncharacterized protein (DUF362 family)
MIRRKFLQLPAAASAAAATGGRPAYTIHTPYPSGPDPNRYPGVVISTPLEESPPSVRSELAAAMKALTGASNDVDAWRSFITPRDVVGIKVNCSGAPRMMSHPLVVGEIARCLTACGVASRNIYVFERFGDQLTDANFTPYLPDGAQIHAMETGNRYGRGLIQYDRQVFVEADFFGEEQTRSFLSRLVSRTLTKIINVPNMKDHGASGVTGCLKNIAYGSFSNVARSHAGVRTNTLSFIGTLYSTEPLRSRTVLHIMDGIRGVWQGGPFLQDEKFLFTPKRMLVGTDPVAMDRILLDVIEAKRKQEGWPSVWDRSPEAMKLQRFEREPGHIAYAGSLGLGVADRERIRLREVAA